MQDIEVRINGERKLVSPSSTIADLLRGADFELRYGAVALNESFLPRDEYATQVLRAGDRVEVLMPFAGG